MKKINKINIYKIITINQKKIYIKVINKTIENIFKNKIK